MIKKANVPNNLSAVKLAMPVEGKTTVITFGRIFISDALSSDQEDTDTKVILHCHDVLINSNGSVILRLASGDTDFLVLAVAHIYNEKQSLHRFWTQY